MLRLPLIWWKDNFLYQTIIGIKEFFETLGDFVLKKNIENTKLQNDNSGICLSSLLSTTVTVFCESAKNGRKFYLF